MDDALYQDALSIAARWVGAEEAPDVVHDTLLALLQRYGEEALGNDHLVRRAVRNRAWDRLRRRNQARHGVYPGSVPDTEAAALAELELEDAIQRAWHGRAWQDQPPLSLLLAFGFSAAEIAVMTGKPRATVKSAVFRERARLWRWRLSAIREEVPGD